MRASRGSAWAALVLSMAVLAAGIVTAITRTSEDTPSTGPQPEREAWEVVRDRVAEAGGVTKDIALDWFATLIAPVPGGTPIAGGGLPPSGSQAVRYVAAVWDELDDAQRSAVSGALEFPTQGTGRTIPHVSGGTLNGVVRGAPVFQVDTIAATEQLRRLLRVVETRTGTVHRLPVVVTRVVVPDRAHIRNSTIAYTVPGRLVPGTPVWQASFDDPEVCVVALTSRSARLGFGTELDAVLVREAFHCLVADIVGWGVYEFLPDWLVEGAANWAALDVVGAEPDWVQRFWSSYFSDREPLLYRSHDAVGFFAQLAASGVDVWHLIVPMHASGGEGALDLALRRAGQSFLILWAPQLARKDAWGPSWDTVGPPAFPEGRQPQALGATSAPNSTDVRPTEQGLWRITVSGDAVALHVSGNGFGAMRWDEGGAETSSIEGAFDLGICVAGDCTCPGGLDPGLIPEPERQGNQLVVALTDPDDRASITVESFTLDELCEAREVTDRGITIEGSHPIDIDVVTACEIRPYASRASETLLGQEAIGRTTNRQIDLELRAAFIDEDEDEAATLDLWRLRGTWLPVRMDWGPLSIPFDERSLPRNTGVGLNWPENRPDVEFHVDEETLSGTFSGIVRADPSDPNSRGGTFTGSFNCGEEIPFPTPGAP